MDYGIISLVPILFVCVVAVLTKRVLEPLLLGGFLGFILVAKQNFLLEWLNGLYAVVGNPDVQFILIIPVLFGIFTVLLQQSGSANRFVLFAERYAKSAKSSLVASWIFGLIIFIDDYLNTMIVGPAMRKLTDRHGVPREMLGYVLKGTSSPLAVLTPFSTWAVFLSGLLMANDVVAEGIDRSVAYLSVIPYVLYGMVALILVPLVILGIVPTVGRLKAARDRARDTGRVFPEEDPVPGGTAEDASFSANVRLFDFFIPVIALVAVKILLAAPMEIAVICGIIACGLLYLPRKIMKPSEFFDSVTKGMEMMVPLIILMILAFIMVEANDHLGLTNYIINITLPLLNKSLFPFIVFIVTCVLGFFCGSFWGVAAILMPIIIPMAVSLGVNTLLASGAVISGIVFASHACFFGDSLLLASFATEVKPMRLALAVLPYAIISAVVSAAGYLIMGVMAI
jgi:Na+/H+ antiporter NhaC